MDGESAADEFARLLREEVDAALADPAEDRHFRRLVLDEVRPASGGEWPAAVVLLRDPHRPRLRFGFHATADLPGGDPSDRSWLPTAASLASSELRESVLPVLRAPRSAADPNGVIWA